MGDALRRAIGMADLCEIGSAAFSYPAPELAAALVDGSLSADLAACLEDAGFSDRGGAALRPLEPSRGSSEELLGAMRKGYSLLYLAPGGRTPVWPYESAFRLAAEDAESMPVLFRSPCQIDVERHMREAGVLPKDARTEPSDSVWNELSFMSYLYGNAAKALHEGREADAAEWSGRIVRFWDEHASRWLPAFMERTAEEAPRHSFGAEYAVLAEAGLLVLRAIEGNVESMRVGA